MFNNAVVLNTKTRTAPKCKPVFNLAFMRSLETYNFDSVNFYIAYLQNII
jgi:hypothetical protein